MADKLAPLDYYKWYWKRFHLSRNVQRLHYAARGFYRELLDEQFAEGFIPDDLRQLAEICDCPMAVMEEHWPSLEKFFPVVCDGQRVNPNLEEQRTELDQKRAQQSRAGKLSAATKASLKATNVDQIPTNVEQALPNLNGRSTLPEDISTDDQPEEKRREEIERREEERSTLPVATQPDPGVTAVAVRETKPIDAIYEIYPRKEGRKKAIEAIEKAIKILIAGRTSKPRPAMTKRAAEEFLFLAAEQYAASEAGRQPNKTKIPHPATWFNQERFDDDRANWKFIGNDGKRADKTDGNAAAIQQILDERGWSGDPAGLGGRLLAASTGEVLGQGGQPGHGAVLHGGPGAIDAGPVHQGVLDSPRAVQVLSKPSGAPRVRFPC